MRRALAVLVLLMGCQPKPIASLHYVLGKPYQVGSVWYYPTETYNLRDTGLASVIQPGHAPLTTDGEVFDQDAIAGTHPSIQLPAIARITNLQNGLAMVVRLNDRGSGNPARLVEVTQRVASRLGIQGVTRVRLEVLADESHAAVDALADAPKLAIQSAPRGAVQVAELPPPPGARAVGGISVARAGPVQAEAVRAAPLRLPDTVTQGRPEPGELWVRLDTFEDYQYAAVQRAKVSGLRPRIVSVFEGRSHRFRVEIGPVADVRQAEAMLGQALAAGIPDARIVVE